MPPFGPIARPELIRALRRAGAPGTFNARNHEYMLLGSKRITIPNPHGSDIGRGLLATILRQAKISREVWQKL